MQLCIRVSVALFSDFPIPTLAAEMMSAQAFKNLRDRMKHGPKLLEHMTKLRAEIILRRSGSKHYYDKYVAHYAGLVEEFHDQLGGATTQLGQAFPPT